MTPDEHVTWLNLVDAFFGLDMGLVWTTFYFIISEEFF
jgi:hypothetical protein